MGQVWSIIFATGGRATWSSGSEQECRVDRAVRRPALSRLSSTRHGAGQASVTIRLDDSPHFCGHNAGIGYTHNDLST